MRQRLSALLTIKSLVTLTATAVFAALALGGQHTVAQRLERRAPPAHQKARLQRAPHERAEEADGKGYLDLPKFHKKKPSVSSNSLSMDDFFVFQTKIVQKVCSSALRSAPQAARQTSSASIFACP